MRRMFRRRGEEEYAVVANKMAPTLRRKSVRSDAAEYGAKKERRDCRADQSKTEAWTRQILASAWHIDRRRTG
jgi:hypothetical protein